MICSLPHSSTVAICRVTGLTEVA
jgi:hypothetical protein